MRKIQVAIIIGAFSFSTYGQVAERTKFSNKNSIQVEAFGHGLFYSINYERVILNGERLKTTVQAGLSYYPPKYRFRDFWIPLEMNELLSFNKHHIELGAGYVVIREALRNSEYKAQSWIWDGFISGRIGYRYQSQKGRYIFKYINNEELQEFKNRFTDVNDAFFNLEFRAAKGSA